MAVSSPHINVQMSYQGIRSLADPSWQLLQIELMTSTTGLKVIALVSAACQDASRSESLYLQEVRQGSGVKLATEPSVSTPTWSCSALEAATMQFFLVFRKEGVSPKDVFTNSEAYIDRSRQIVVHLPKLSGGEQVSIEINYNNLTQAPGAKYTITSGVSTTSKNSSGPTAAVAATKSSSSYNSQYTLQAANLDAHTSPLLEILSNRHLANLKVDVRTLCPPSDRRPIEQCWVRSLPLKRQEGELANGGIVLVWHQNAEDLRVLCSSPCMTDEQCAIVAQRWKDAHKKSCSLL